MKNKIKPKKHLSLFNEFIAGSDKIESDTTVYKTALDEETLKRIEIATKLADIPAHLQTGNKTDNKQITNGQQTDNKTDNKQVTNGQQTDNKQITAEQQTDNKQVTKRITKQITNGQQTDNKQITKCSFESLVGHEKNLLLLIFKECLRIGSLISPEITLSHIHDSLEISPGVAKTVIYRLVKKGVIKRETSKTGRGGWIKFVIEKELYQDLLIRETDNKRITNGQQTDNKQVTKQVTKQITNGPYNNNNNINNNIIIIEPDIMLPEILEGTGISKRNLAKLIEDGTTTLEVVNNSLEALAYDYEHGHLKTPTPARLLFRVLKTGNEYTSAGLEHSLKEEVEKAIRRSEEIKKLRAQVEEEKLRARFYEYLTENPNFEAKVRARYNFFPENEKLVEELLFAEFKKMNDSPAELSN